MISVPQRSCELQRDRQRNWQRNWQRKETVPAFMNLCIETGSAAGIQFSYDRAGDRHPGDYRTGAVAADSSTRACADGHAVSPLR